MPFDLAHLLHSGEFYAAACALLWAFAVILFRKSGEHVEPVALNLFKDAIALICLSVTLPLLGIPFRPAGTPSSDWLLLYVSGVLGIAIADTLFFASLNRLGAGRSAIIDCCYSPFVVLCSTLFLHEPRRLTLYVAMALMVTAILVGDWKPEKVADKGQKARIRNGMLLGVASMAVMAVGIVLAKPVLDHSDAWWATWVRLVGGFSFLCVQALFPVWRGGVSRVFRPGPVWFSAIPAALVGSYLAMTMWVAGMKYTSTTVAGVLNQLSTIFVILLATIVLHERLTLRKIAALALGMAGAITVML
jgi:drug/metabolite transporter (DMT)-like permease